MSNSIFIDFRGEQDVEVEYIDHGVDDDTGAHPLEWSFVDPKFSNLVLTSDEEVRIMQRIAQAAFDNQRDDDFQ